LLRRGSSGDGHGGPGAEEVDGDDLGELLAVLAEPVAVLAEPMAAMAELVAVLADSVVALAMAAMIWDREASPWRRGEARQSCSAKSRHGSRQARGGAARPEVVVLGQGKWAEPGFGEGRRRRRLASMEVVRRRSGSWWRRAEVFREGRK
jgi:hypothetical protein